MKPPVKSLYGEAPLGMECAIPDAGPRLAHTGTGRLGFWARLRYRYKYGIRVTPEGRPYKAA